MMRVVCHDDDDVRWDGLKTKIGGSESQYLHNNTIFSSIYMGIRFLIILQET